MSIAEIYTTAVHQNFKPLFANWEPANPIRLGDYGLLRDNVFHYQGNIKDLGIDFDVRKAQKADRKSFTSSASSEVKLHAKGEAYAKATLEIQLHTSDAVFFNAADCHHSLIADQPALGRTMIERYRAGSWKREWVIITELVEAGATTIAVSGGTGAMMLLEAEGPVELIDLADASAKLSLRQEKNVGFKLIAGEKLIPLVGFGQIQRPFLIGKPDFNPVLLSRSETAAAEPEEDPEEPVFFGQLSL